ncbi:MAG: hypothetical protein GC200_01080 [Tepidisphaera sp.]|nr:hypothetical protein [Tepidisphaera sp.]
MAGEPSAIEVLATSSDAGALTKAAQELAASKDAAGFDALRASLENAKFLDAIDPPAKPPASRLAMNLWKILRTLSENKAKEARGVIEALTQAPAYQKHIARVDLLLEATETLRPPGPKVVEYWKTYSGHADIHAPVLQRILIANRSGEALGLFGEMMANEGFGAERRVNWIHAGVPAVRNDAGALVMVTKLVDDKRVSPQVRLGAVEAVFDWDDEWVPIHGPGVYRPEARALMHKPAREQVRAIAKAARAWLPIPGPLDAKITGVLAELDTLDSREKPAHGGS